jgi:hypothetical protein
MFSNAPDTSAAAPDMFGMTPDMSGMAQNRLPAAVKMFETASKITACT